MNHSDKFKKSIFLFGVFFLTVFEGSHSFASGWGSSGDFKKTPENCPKIAENIKKYEKDARALELQIKNEREAAKSLGPNEDSKRMKSTSTLFVYAAKLEAAQNMKLAALHEQDLNCSTKKNTKAQKHKRANSRGALDQSD